MSQGMCFGSLHYPFVGPWEKDHLTKSCHRCHSAIVIALEDPAQVYNVFWDLVFRIKLPWPREIIDEQCEERRSTEVLGRIREFMEALTERQAFL
jgi:hypothetical protein